MLTRERVIEKVKTLPENILDEVNDFIDFLKIQREKRKDMWEWLKRNQEKIGESDFRDYLAGLTSYEDMLAKGKIRWK